MRHPKIARRARDGRARAACKDNSYFHLASNVQHVAAAAERSPRSSRVSRVSLASLDIHAATTAARRQSRHQRDGNNDDNDGQHTRCGGLAFSLTPRWWDARAAECSHCALMVRQNAQQQQQQHTTSSPQPGSRFSIFRIATYYVFTTFRGVPAVRLCRYGDMLPLLLFVPMSRRAFQKAMCTMCILVGEHIYILTVRMPLYRSKAPTELTRIYYTRCSPEQICSAYSSVMHLATKAHTHTHNISLYALAE